MLHFQCVELSTIQRRSLSQGLQLDKSMLIYAYVISPKVSTGRMVVEGVSHLWGRGHFGCQIAVGCHQNFFERFWVFCDVLEAARNLFLGTNPRGFSLWVDKVLDAFCSWPSLLLLEHRCGGSQKVRF